MLTHPYGSIPFAPEISYILAGISIYDKEETLGEALWAFDPNKQSDRDKIIKKFIIPNFDYLTYRHKFLVFKMLEDTLQQPDFDFSSQFVNDYEEYRALAWDQTEINDPRGFFEDIYRLANEAWKDDIHKASLEDQSMW
ncbi:hypothetical protein [Pseudomonas fluorescens]|uniref:hypothetical protein n=1 Tax=Pseudomonas fluorescens TaxID=294 RepID=UPI00191293ED|nr:hypothetical protein [Pseudomonas fluorescens]